MSAKRGEAKLLRMRTKSDKGEGVFCPMQMSAWYVAVAVSLTANAQLPADVVRHVLPICVEQPGQAHPSSVWTILPFAGGQTQPQPNTHTRQLPPLTMPRMLRLAPLPYISRRQLWDHGLCRACRSQLVRLAAVSLCWRWL